MDSLLLLAMEGVVLSFTREPLQWVGWKEVGFFKGCPLSPAPASKGLEELGIDWKL